MSPYETIKAKYEASEHVESWVWWMTYYAHFGYWFNEPDFFICGEYKEIDGKRCWYIFAMAGDMAKAWSIRSRLTHQRRLITQPRIQVH